VLSRTTAGRLGGSACSPGPLRAAWAAAHAPGPLRAFFIRIQSRRGKQVAAFATARKIAVLAWHLLTKDENYAWARPALLANKIRKVELLADQPVTKGISTCQLVSRFLSGELPFDARTGSVSLSLPGFDFGDEGLPFADAAIQTFATQQADFDFPPY
jgi:hypothetical protein